MESKRESSKQEKTMGQGLGRKTRGLAAAAMPGLGQAKAVPGKAEQTVALSWGQCDRNKLICDLQNELYKHLLMMALKLASHKKPLSEELTEI